MRTVYVTNKNSSLKMIGCMLMCMVISLVAQLGTSIFWDMIFTKVILSKTWQYHIVRSITAILVTILLLYLYTDRVLHLSFKTMRISTFKWQWRYIVCAVLLPLLVSSALMLSGGQLFHNALSKEAIISNIVWVIICGVQAGITEEMLFRGYLMKLLEMRWNRNVAILAPSLFFAVLHVTGMSKFTLSGFLLLMCAGTMVGIMFSLVTYASGSIWMSVLIHSLWNSIMIGGVLEIATYHNDQVIYSFKLASTSSLLTGGEFGIEASLFAIIGYMVVSFVAWLHIRTK